MTEGGAAADADIAEAFEGQAVSDVFQPGYGETAGLMSDLQRSFEPHSTVFSYEVNRITQALQAAGIDPAMLTPMARATVLRALNTNMTLFEESGAGVGMFYQTHAIRDAVTETEEERAQREGRPGPSESRTNVLHEPEPSPEVQSYWEKFQHNLGAVVLGVGGLMAAGASMDVVAREYEAYRDATPDFPGSITPFVQNDRSAAQATGPNMAQAVNEGMRAPSDDILTRFQQRVDNIDISSIKSELNQRKEGGWVQMIENERGSGLPQPDHTPHVPGAGKSRDDDLPPM